MLTDSPSRSTFADEPEQKSRRIAGVLTLLLLLALGWGGYQWKRGGDLMATNQTLSQQTDSLTVAKTRLETDIQALSAQLETVRTENTGLGSRLTVLNQTLAERDRVLKSLRKDNATLATLRRQVRELNRVRASLNEQLGLLRQDNQRLKVENSRLREQNQSLVAENGRLRDDARPAAEPTLGAPLLQANALRVEVVQRRDRLTVKARRAREIAVMVELPKDLPVTDGQNLYLSLKDLQQQPLRDSDARTVTIQAPGVMNPVVAHVTQAFDLGQNPQRITLRYKPDERLKAGIYAAELFTDGAFLGRVEFRLR